ncbi:MAG: cation transporter [Planctomycetaceae bacterium]|nr:MAG: cation transporter [Planctomycetaceae bacterium]
MCTTNQRFPVDEQPLGRTTINDLKQDNSDRYRAGWKATMVGIVGNLVLAILKGVIGFLTGSVALVADAFHSVSDTFSSIIVLVGLSYSRLPADHNHHYGHAKAESIVAKIVAVMLLIGGLAIAWSALQMIVTKAAISVPGSAALWAAGLSILAKEAMYQYAIRVARRINSSAVRADAWHHRTDAFSSIAAVIGIGGAMIGFPVLDPIAGVVVATMIVWAAVGIYWSAALELMDPAPCPDLMEELRRDALEISGILAVHQIKGRQNGPKIFIDLKIGVQGELTVLEGHRLASEAKHLIIRRHPDVEDVLVHVNPAEIDDRG